MQSNDFKAAGEFLHDDYVLEWPQSGARVHGRANFVAINESYPAYGRWEFVLHRLTVTDGRADAYRPFPPFEKARPGGRQSSGPTPSNQQPGARDGWK